MTKDARRFLRGDQNGNVGLMAIDGICERLIQTELTAMPSKPPQIRDPIEHFDCVEAELVVGLVCAVGADYGPIRDSLTEILKKCGYSTHVVKISSVIPKLTDYRLDTSSEIARIGACQRV
jgi:hypothetical protein